MVDKILALLNKIAAEPEHISDCVRANPSEVFFKFKGHPFSMIQATKRDEQYGDYSLYMYPKYKGSIQTLASIPFMGDNEDPEMLSFHCGTYSASDRKAFISAYTTLLMKESEADLIIDEILET